MNETGFADVEGYEGRYVIYDSGHVFSLPNKNRKKIRLMKANLDPNGYVKVGLRNGMGQKNISLHRLIANHFIPNPDNKTQVNHINGIKTDNRLDNLEWCTPSENTIHAFRTGLRRIFKGEQKAQSKLTNSDVLSIRSDTRIYTEIAKEYGVCKQLICNIKLRKVWRHIE